MGFSSTQSWFIFPRLHNSSKTPALSNTLAIEPFVRSSAVIATHTIYLLPFNPFNGFIRLCIELSFPRKTNQVVEEFGTLRVMNNQFVPNDASDNQDPSRLTCFSYLAPSLPYIVDSEIDRSSRGWRSIRLQLSSTRSIDSIWIGLRDSTRLGRESIDSIDRLD